MDVVIKYLIRIGLIGVLSLSVSSLDASSLDVSFRLPVIAQKHIALTFDDGPHPVITPQILDILDKYQVKATFFLVANQAQKFPDLVHLITSKGHDIGNHSLSHQYYTQLSRKELVYDFEKSQQVLKQIVGYYPLFLRPPYGKVDERVKKIAKQYFFEIALWDNDSRDWEASLTVKEIVDNVLIPLRSRNIILMHSNQEITLRALPNILDGIQSRSLKLVLLKDAFNIY